MQRRSHMLVLSIIAAAFIPAVAAASALLPVGFVSVTAGGLPNTASFDIANETGLNDTTFPDTTFPVMTPVTISSFVLTIDFQGGGSVTEDSSQFLSDGSQGFTGNFSIDLASFPISTATLTGILSPTTVTLNDGATVQEIYPAFSATILPSTGNTLQVDDLAIINATAAPEPDSWALMGLGVLSFTVGKLKRRFSGEKNRLVAGPLRCVASLLVTNSAGGQTEAHRA